MLLNAFHTFNTLLYVGKSTADRFNLSTVLRKHEDRFLFFPKKHLSSILHNIVKYNNNFLACNLNNDVLFARAVNPASSELIIFVYEVEREGKNGKLKIKTSYIIYMGSYYARRGERSTSLINR